MNETALQKTLDAITDRVLKSRDLSEILIFSAEVIGQTLNIKGAIFSRLGFGNYGVGLADFGEGESLSLPILHEANCWGKLILSADSHTWETAEIEFLERVIVLIQIALQKTELDSAYQRSEQEKQELLDRFGEQTIPSKYELESCHPGNLYSANLVKMAPVAIFKANLAGNYLYVNQSWCQITGFSWEDALGSGWLKTVHPEDRNGVFQSWQLSRQQHSPFSDEFRILRPDQTICWVYAQIVPELTREGTVNGYVGTLTDINNLKQIERNLQIEQQQLSAITANIPVGLYRFIYHTDGRVSLPYASAGFEELLELHPQLLTIYPKLALDCIHPEDRLKIQLAIAHLQTGEWSENTHDYLDHRIISPSGRVKWVRDHANFAWTETGDLILDGVIIDISERRSLENAIRQIAKGVSSAVGEAFFYSLVEYLAMVLDMDFALIGLKIPETGQVRTIAIYGDGGFQDNITYDLAGTPCDKVIDSQVCYYRDRVRKHFPDALILEEMEIESYLGTSLVNHQGENIGLITVLSRQPMLDNEIAIEILQIFAVRAIAELERQAVLTSLQEINEQLEERVLERTRELASVVEQLNEEIIERIHIEAALRKSEVRYRHLVTMIPYGVQECDLSGLITYSNPAHNQMYGFAPGTVTGTYIWDRLTNEKQKQELKEYLADRNREQPTLNFYLTVEMTEEGREIDVQIDWTDQRDEQGQIIGYISILSNITKRLQAEQEIEKALLKEQELNQLKSYFIDVASHEFRTPLTVILGSIQFLIKRYHQLTDEKCFEYFYHIQEAGLQIKELIEDLLAISRADSGRIPIDSQLVNLDRMVRELIEEIQVASGNERIFTLSMGNLPNLVSLDEKLLRHVLTNLLYNAVKYSTKDSCIYFSIDRQENKIIFTITDAGIGILPEDIIHIFEPFHRGRNTSDIPGTGLGLNIAKKYVELLGGTISFTSQIGIGSIFVVTLPLSK